MTTNLYALIEARPGHQRIGEPFYIGIGTASRPYKHLADSRRKGGHRNLRLHEVLSSHRLLGVTPGVTVLGVFPDKATAGEAEKEAIKCYGRQGIEDGGTLCNLAGGGQGPDSTIMQMPEIRARISAAGKNCSPETLAARIAGLDFARNDPEAKAKHAKATSVALRAYWSDPEKRAKHAAALRGKKKTLSPASLEARRANANKGQTAEVRAAKAEGNRKRFADPAERAKVSEQAKARWADAESRQAMLAGRSAGISASWKDPETKARRIAGIRAAMAKKAQVGPGEHEESS